MRTRWILAASILVLMVAVLPGALRAAEAPACAPAAAVAAPANTAVNAPTPAAPDLPLWAAPLPAPSETPRALASEPLFLANCSQCFVNGRCRPLHSCVVCC